MVDETPAVDGHQLKTTESTLEAHSNVRAKAAGVMHDKASHVTITEKIVNNLRVQKEKEFPMKSSETNKYVNRPCSFNITI